MILEAYSPMRYIAILSVVCLFVANTVGTSQERPVPIPARLTELIANPEKFDGKLITVRGFFLVSGRHHDIVAYFLCLSREDAENDLGNSIMVVPNAQMQKGLEKIDRMYVILTGSVHGYHVAGSSQDAVLKDITDYRVWSDPNHPILLKGDDSAKIK
jgi:hypothetical protein